MTAQAGLSAEEARKDPEFRGRLIESAVGVHLANAAAGGTIELFYWRERNREVDFVLRRGKTLVALEVKSGRAPAMLPGLEEFVTHFKPRRTMIVGDCPLDKDKNLIYCPYENDKSTNHSGAKT